MTDNATFTREAGWLLDQRIAQIQQLQFSDASELPEASGEDLVISGKKCALTVYCQRLVEGDLLVTVQIARRALANFVSFHQERGLVFSEDGDVREATEEELLITGG